MWDSGSWLEAGFSSAHCLECWCLKSFCEGEREKEGKGGVTEENCKKNCRCEGKRNRGRENKTEQK